MTGWMEWPTRFATVTSPSFASAVYDPRMYLNALEFLEEEREAWRPFEALDSLTDDQLDVPIEAAHEWSGRDLISHLVAWQQNALEVAKELAVGETSPTKERSDREWD